MFWPLRLLGPGSCYSMELSQFSSFNYYFFLMCLSSFIVVILFFLL